MRPIALLCLLTGTICAQWPEIRLQRIASGLANPTDIAAVPDGSGRLFVLEQPGRVRVIRGGALQPEPVLTLSTLSAGGERGLLGIAFPPGFASKRYFYLNYTDPQGASVVSRWRLTADPERADPGTEQVILRIVRTASNHNGGGIVFGPDGMLWIGTGDSGGGGDPANAAQNPNELRGKMLRIDTESGTEPYAVPASNPFVNRANYRPEIWATGLRNPWRYSFDRETGDLWIADVGQNRAEEVNFQSASSPGGENYGWDMMEGLQCYPPGSTCNPTGLTLPILEYTRNLGVSITGGLVYRGQRFPSMRGIYLYADFGSGRIWGVRRAGNSWENRELLDTAMQISTFGQDEAGELYVADHSGGAIYAIASGGPSISADGVVNAASFGPGLVPGSLGTIFGAGITASEGVVEATVFPLPTELGGVSVLLNDAAVPLTAVARTTAGEQVNFQIPWELAGATRANLRVRAFGVTTDPVEITLAQIQPEIFALTRSGSNITIWATGLGAVSTQQTSGRPAPSQPLATTTATTSVTLNGVSVPVTYSGLAPGFAGLSQINASVPENASGELILRVGQAASQPRELAAHP
jgi:uncharacterized protein (TIGR03437 family)